MFVVTDSYLEGILREDIPWMDATVDGLGIESVPGRIDCYPKAAGLVWGVDWAARLFRLCGLTVTYQAADGTSHAAKEVVLSATGSAGAIHAVYKTAQNIMEYGSGIANRTHAMVSAARAVNPAIQVAVTRKHFPGTKLLSLMAAMAGGAIVHRAGLSETILVFDQHRVFCSDPVAAVARAKKAEPEKKVAVEVSSIEEGLTYVHAGADIIQCERFAPEDLAALVSTAKAVRSDLIINAAGGVNAENAAQYAATGVDVLVTSWVYFGKPFDIKMAIAAE